MFCRSSRRAANRGFASRPEQAVSFEPKTVGCSETAGQPPAFFRPRRAGVAGGSDFTSTATGFGTTGLRPRPNALASVERFSA
jgi:hypothetical protein